MTYEEALDKMTNLAVTYSQIDADTCELLTIAKKAIEKQIPKKPLLVPDGKSKIHTFKCPTCGQAMYRVRLFCDDCGQALDWSDEQ